MRQRIYWLKATIYIAIVVAPLCCVNAYNYELDQKLKKLANDYGDRLSSFENAMPNKRLKDKSKLHSVTTRCTTDESVTLGLGFTLKSSDEAFNTEQGTKETANTEKMFETVEDYAGPGSRDPEQNIYKPPPSPKSPDHYIDDP